MEAIFHTSQISTIILVSDTYYSSIYDIFYDLLLYICLLKDSETI